MAVLAADRGSGFVPTPVLCLSQSPPASLIPQVSAGRHSLRKPSWTPRSKFAWDPTTARATLLCTHCPELGDGLPHLAQYLSRNRRSTDDTRCPEPEGGFHLTVTGRGQPAAVVATVRG